MLTHIVWVQLGLCLLVVHMQPWPGMQLLRLTGQAPTVDPGAWPPAPAQCLRKWGGLQGQS